MATEVAFAKSFLSLLDSKPPKISPDHVENPRNYPATSPYILPRHPNTKPFSKPPRPTHPPTTTGDDPSSSSSSAATTTTTPGTGTGTDPTATAQRKIKTNPGAEPAVPVLLRSARNPPLELALPAIGLSTALGELKARLAAETGIPLDKIKLLHGKRPVGDTKVLKELVPEGEKLGQGGVELGVMVLGGAASVPVKSGGGGGGEQAAAGPVAQGLSGAGVLETGQFWEDLKGFLQQRVRDEAVAGEALGVFKGAWDGRAA